ncbi:MAG: HlyD family efflux transporter periplasmic adaptor subunit [Halanaerobium sp.]
MKIRKAIFNFRIFVIIFILVISGIIVFQIFCAARLETILAEQGEVIDGFWTNALVIRDEKVIETPVSGRVEYIAEEGDRAPYGCRIAEIESKDKIRNIFNSKAGIISFAVDGLEDKLNKDQLNQLDLDKFDQYKGDYQHRISGKMIQESEPLYRIINNFELFLIVPAEKKQAERFRENEIVFVQENNSSDLLKAKVMRINHESDKSYIFVKMDLFVPEWINLRKVKINFIKNIYRGIKISRKAVFNQPSGRGVLKITGYNQYQFQEIEIIDGNQEEVIISGLEIGDEIITNPEDFNYGRED